MTRPWSMVAALISTVALTAIASAQEPSGLAEPVTVKPGHRVKVTLASRIAPGPLIGTVFFIDPDSVVVQRGDASQRVVRAQVSRIEVSAARDYRPGEAALHGFLVTSPLTAISVAFFIMGLPDVSRLAGNLALLSGGGGALAGLLVGGTTPQDEWVEGQWPEPVEATDPADAGDPDHERRPVQDGLASDG